MNTLIRYALPLLLSALSSHTRADTLQLNSQSGQTTMLELYASQGCSSRSLAVDTS
jgi:hypothetical protein